MTITITITATITVNIVVSMNFTVTVVIIFLLLLSGSSVEARLRKGRSGNFLALSIPQSLQNPYYQDTEVLLQTPTHMHRTLIPASVSCSTFFSI